MSLKRKLFDDLVNWKNERNGRSAVLIEGARRVGKSYLVLEFAKKMYKSFILVDFNNPLDEIRNLFLNPIPDFEHFFSKLFFKNAFI
jgi:predicted AAA+ superfamily ATPase